MERLRCFEFFPQPHFDLLAMYIIYNYYIKHKPIIDWDTERKTNFNVMKNKFIP